MKAMKILAAVAFGASVAMNVYFWQQLERSRAETEALRAGAMEAETLRAENAATKAQSEAKPTSANSDADTRELAQLRNEVGPLRKQVVEIESLRRQAAEAGQLRAQLNQAKRDLTAAENAMADVMKITPEELLALKGEGHSTACINNMKQIGLAASIYAKEHGGVFPPDFVSMATELANPKILYCPAAPGGAQATEWAQLNPSTISYQFLNPNGNATDAQKPLTMCPIHGHVGLSDGSVHRGNK
jgi:hypothetical protein